MENYRMLSDDQLVSLYAQGDDTAFDTLLFRHKDKLYSYINNMVKDNDVAEDIFQETFIKAITSIRDGKYTAVGRFYGWLTRVAHNLMMDMYRQAGTYPTYRYEEQELELMRETQTKDAAIERLFATDSCDAQVVALLNQLPQQQQEVVRMRFYADLSFKEIAQQTHVSINTALGRMRYALINLRKMADAQQISPSSC